jgi:hypothetical protein
VVDGARCQEAGVALHAFDLVVFGVDGVEVLAAHLLAGDEEPADTPPNPGLAETPAMATERG